MSQMSEDLLALLQIIRTYDESSDITKEAKRALLVLLGTIK